ncbi:cell division protein PerM [Phycicoccus avicenniae]|uniref:cell division protein PerM n=1 Tax=Phycicoccus avicenniae TaxID=2828860 RepID=UPI003D27C316
MTVTDRLRAALPGSDDPPEGSGSPWGPGWRRSGLIGVLTGLVSALVVVGPVLLAWSTDPRSAASAGDAAAVGWALWLLAGGAHLGVGGATVSMVPLLALGVLVLLARFGAREAMVQVSTEGEHWAGVLPRPLAASVSAWWAGYALVVAAGWLLAAQGPFVPRPWSVLLPLVGVPALALAVALRAVGRDDPDVLGPRLVPVLPDTVRRAVGPGLAGATLLVSVGMLVVLGATALAWPQVAAVQAELGATGGGSAVLLGAQAAGLANLGTWVVSFVAGPGFSVVDGASVSWDGSEGGLLPMLPVLAALPQPGRFPGIVGVVCVLLVVAAGVWVGRRAVATVARLSRLRTKVAVATSACLVTAGAIGVLDAVGGGSLGQFRLSSIGAPGGELALVLFAELLVGALAYVARDAWRLRR